MKFFKHLIKLMEARNEILRGIKTKLKKLDKTLVCVVKEIRELTHAIKRRKQSGK